MRLHSSVLFYLCVESLQLFVNVLSEVDLDGEIGANPTAAVASASGINPVSRQNRVYTAFRFHSLKSTKHSLRKAHRLKAH